MFTQFEFFGNGNWHAGIKGNHVKGRQSGINCVRFADGNTIHYELPGIMVKGVLLGITYVQHTYTGCHDNQVTG